MPDVESLESPEAVFEKLGDVKGDQREGVLGSGKYDALREMAEGLDSDIVKLIAAAEDRMKGLTGELAYVEGNMTR